MNNFAFIENSLDKNTKNYSNHINSAINMLKNSYKDLSYISENEKISYLKKEINLSKFLIQRIDFFNTVAQTKEKKISHNIEKNIYIYMNETELERLIDNNISNAVKHSDSNSEILIKLHSINKLATLKFKSSSKEIKNKDMIFEKNFQEQIYSLKGLGLGLFMVKSICIKNNITYKVEYKDGFNVFIYRFKDID